MHPRLVVAYTGREALDGCRRLLEEQCVRIVPFGEPAALGISAAGSHIFTADEIAAHRLGIVNLHLAPLPEYRGRYSATHALLAGERRFGVTLHYVDAGIDTGPVIARRDFPIASDETMTSLRAKAVVTGLRLYADVLPRLLGAATRDHKLISTPQDERRARYFDRFSLPVSDGSRAFR